MTGRNAWLVGGGEMGEQIRAYDWAASPLGAPDCWPQELHTAVRLMLATRHPMFIFWGDQHICFYNDAYRASLGPEKHPAILGMPGREAWPESWDIIGPQIDLVMRGEGATWHVNQLVPIVRHGALQEVYWTYSYGPIGDGDASTGVGGVGGVLVVCTETTEQVLIDRHVRASEARESLLVRLLQGQRETDDPRKMMAAAAEAVGNHLAANRVGFFELRDDDTLDFDSGFSWTDGGLAPLTGTVPATVIGTHYLAELRAGRTLGIADTALDPLTADSQFGRIAAQSIICAPIIRNGRWQAGLYVNHVAVRRWTDEEILLVRYVANQTWDAVERARTRIALGESEERLRLALDAAGMGVYFWDPIMDRTDADDRLREILGLNANEAFSLATALEHYIHPDDRERYAAAAAAMLDPSGPGRLAEEVRWRGSDGEDRWLAFTGQTYFSGTGANRRATRAVGIATDVTDRRRAQQQLQSSEERFRTLIQRSADVIQLVAPDGTITYSSDSVESVLGYHPDEIAGRNIAPYVHPDDFPETTAWLADIARTPGGVDSRQYRIRHKDGSWIWVETTIANHLGTPNIDAIVGNFRAITARKAAEDALSADLAGMRRLYDLNRHLSQAETVTETLGEILAAAIEFTGTDRGNIQLVEHDGAAVDLVVQQGHGPAFLEHLKRGVCDAVCKAALRTRGQVIIEDVTRNATVAGTVDLNLLLEDGIRSLQVTPLISRHGGVIGMLTTHSPEPRVPTAQQSRMLDLLAWMAADFVERAQTERSLREREARFRALVQNVRDYAILGLDPDGVVIEWTEGAERVKGYTADEVLGKHVSMFYTPEDIAAGVPERELGRAAATGRAEREAWRVRKGGGRFWANEIATSIRDETGKLVGFTKISRDLTERRQAEEALRASEERFRSALEIETVGVVFFDQDSRITDANDAFLRMTGFSRKDLESGRLRWDELTPPEWIERTQQDVEELGTTGQSAPYEKEFYRKDGSRQWGLFAGKALGNGVAVEFVLDITDRKRAEEERETFAATAAHDLKTPLTALRGQAQLMLRRSRLGRLGDGAALEVGLGAIDAAVGRMVALVDEMMDAAHLRAGRTLELVLAPIDIVALAEETAGEIGQGAPRHSVRVETAESEIIGSWDRARLRRVLGNLLGNAVKYSPLGGDVVIEVGRDADAGGDWAVLSVIDTGLGIPEEDLPRIFEPFHRGGNVGRIGGTGIGLFGARRIVEQHGGTIYASSAEGEGATFTVRLPLHDAGN